MELIDMLFEHEVKSPPILEAKKSLPEVHVYALDFDSMAERYALGLLNKKCPDKKYEHVDLEKWREEFDAKCSLVQDIKKSTQDTKKVLLINGSNRQDLPNDTFNRYNHYKKHGYDPGSCFHFLKQFEMRLKKLFGDDKIELDNFLMPDIHVKNLKDGDTFNIALLEESTTVLLHGSFRRSETSPSH